HILKSIHIYRKNKIWIEPFVGGGNMIDKVTGKRIGYDINQNVINALVIIRDKVDLLPNNNKEFTENDYNNLKKNNDSWLKPFAGFAYSFSGKWLGGWARGNGRDYVKEAKNNAIIQSKKIQNVEFYCKDYKQIKIQHNSLIYCDPPYKNTQNYENNFCHDEFWDWCLWIAKQGQLIFISEYEAPKDFETFMKKENVSSSLDKDTGGIKSIEKLFVPSVLGLKKRGLGIKL
ncbi:MAG: hypothetical protein UT03_C0062G0001, partial [Candidatus Moranbacteria bacterium GW2011_GWD2_38_7]